MKYISSIICFFFGLSLSFSQTAPVYKDTLIFIPLGKSIIQSPVLEKEIVSISAGMFHYSLVDVNGKLTTSIDQSIPWLMPMTIDSDVRSLAIGDIHTVILYKSDSTLNQYFITPSIDAFYPSGLKRIVEIRAGNNLSTALSKKNIMYAWGPGRSVQNLNIPLKTYGVKTASVGKQHIAFINIKDKVFVWGSNEKGQKHIPVFKSKPVKIVSGNNHVLALDELKNVYVWGDNSYGQCLLPVIDEPIKQIEAKANTSLVVTEKNKIVIWGNGNEVKADFGFLGEVKQAKLGYDYAIVLIRSTQEKIQQAYLSNKKTTISVHKQDTLLFAKDTLSIKEAPVTAENFIDKTFTESRAIGNGFNGNTLTVESTNNSSQEDINSSTTIEFDGVNNNLKIINDNVKTLRINSNQRVIIKGSNKNGIIHVRDQNNVIEDQNSVIVIDLDQIGEDNEYPAEYNQAKESNVLSQEMFLPLDSMPGSAIKYFPIDNNDNFYLDGENMGGVSDQKDMEETMYLTGNYYAMAQLAFYYKKNIEGIEFLKTGVREDNSKLCALALFEIYYYGLFDQPIQLEKATIMYSIYNKLL
ncbi:hypothetical protein [Cytophaga aurantiaca]|uniref:hypothetical protein n=1 Tax=Cytophaga aurantiaca TaxID=29530 RepID=UPI00036E9FB2|nr:hypothetical protein [Cytophaga aurantiaca]